MIPVRWDRITPEDFALLRAKAREKGYRLFAMLLPEEAEAARSHAPGPWVPIGGGKNAEVWELGAGM